MEASKSLARRRLRPIQAKALGDGQGYHKDKRFTHSVGEVTGALIDGEALRIPNRQHRKAHEARILLAATAASGGEAARLASTQKGQQEQRRQVECLPVGRSTASP